MAPGAFANNGPVGDYAGGITASVVITSIVAASGGAIFGYDIGISGELSFLSFSASFFSRSNTSTLKNNKSYILSLGSTSLHLY